MEAVLERAFIKAMVKVMSLEDELRDLTMYEDGHQDIVKASIERDLEAWKLILKLINESKSNSK
jgi:hypothetical protein